MALANYGDLKTSVAAWIGRADLTSAVPDFVALCHSQLMRDLKHPRMVKRNAAFSIDAEYEDVPSDFIEIKSFRLTSTATDCELTFMTNETQSAYYGSGTGQPKFVNVGGNSTQGTEQFRFAPVPDGTYTATLDYYAYITFFAADAATNWILTRYPGLYLYGSILQASAYIADDPRLPIIKAAYAEELTMANAAGNRVAMANGMLIRPA